WERQPENPAYFREYSLAHLKQYKKLPPDFLETAARLSPGNAYFPYLAACVMSEGCVGPLSPAEKNGAPNLPQWEINEPSRLEDVLSLLDQTASMPHWESYQAELARERFAILPPAKDTTDRVILMYYLT